MRKRLIGNDDDGASHDEWLDLDTIAQVEVTSEEPTHPIESALVDGGAGWRASRSGDQIIRLRFDEPVSLSRIWLEFDAGAARTHEFVVRWSPDGGRSYIDIVRQQYSFSPPDSTREVEDYTVNLQGVSVLELRIAPDIHARVAPATLKRLRLA